MVKGFTSQLVDQMFFRRMQRVRAELFTAEHVGNVIGTAVILQNQFGDHARTTVLEFVSAFGKPPAQTRLMTDQVIETFADLATIATTDITAIAKIAGNDAVCVVSGLGPAIIKFNDCRDTCTGFQNECPTCLSVMFLSRYGNCPNTIR